MPENEFEVNVSLDIPHRSPLVKQLAIREAFRERYWNDSDPIVDERLLWRAQSIRHTVHLLPGQTILELGCGSLRFTRILKAVSRRENPITAVTFQTELPKANEKDANIEILIAHQLPGSLQGRQFDCIVLMDLLDRTNSADLLSLVFDWLKPGGEVVTYESNPWNPVHKIRWFLSRVFGSKDPRYLLSRPLLYEQFSEIGFVRVYAMFNDFVFAPLTYRLVWILRNLSILLENTPLFNRMAGSILLHGQKPPRQKVEPTVSLATHSELFKTVSVVIPCRNEEMNIEPLVRLLLALYGDYIFEIIPLDDGSTDGSREVMQRLAEEDERVRPVFRKPPNGVGRAIKEGLATARGQWVLTMDCDFQHLLPEFRDLFDHAAQGWDVVVGSRFSRHSVLLNYPFAKIVANRAFHTMARFVFRLAHRDLTNNLKLMRREVVENLQLTQPGFAVNAETGFQPIILGYRVLEIAISWINRSPGMGASSFRLVKVGGGYWMVLRDMLRLRFFKSGPYKTLLRRTQKPAKEL
ncbi:MAG: glycosyltransferase [Verrucomicrobiae bacterium]|nr:glycosyltransferase [Verrucomicrobiae bacterium]